MTQIPVNTPNNPLQYSKLFVYICSLEEKHMCENVLLVLLEMNVRVTVHCLCVVDPPLSEQV